MTRSDLDDLIRERRKEPLLQPRVEADRQGMQGQAAERTPSPANFQDGSRSRNVRTTLVVSMMPMKRAGHPTKTNCWIRSNAEHGHSVDLSLLRHEAAAEERQRAELQEHNQHEAEHGFGRAGSRLLVAKQMSKPKPQRRTARLRGTGRPRG